LPLPISVARALLPFPHLLHNKTFWCPFTPGLGQYRLDSASLHYFPRLALQHMSRHSGQSNISNGKCVGMYHIALWHILIVFFSLWIFSADRAPTDLLQQICSNRFSLFSSSYICFMFFLASFSGVLFSLASFSS